MVEDGSVVVGIELDVDSRIEEVVDSGVEEVVCSGGSTSCGG